MLCSGTAHSATGSDGGADAFITWQQKLWWPGEFQLLKFLFGQQVKWGIFLVQLL